MSNIHAFPFKDENHTQFGMTLRDYFAAQAMQSVIANSMCSDKEATFYIEVAEISYEMADEMLKVRNGNS